MAGSGGVRDGAGDRRAADTDGPALGAVVGLALGQAALRLDWPATTGVSLLVGSAAFLVVAIPALLHVHRRTRRKLTVAGVIAAGAVVIVGGLWGAAALSVRDDLSRAWSTWPTPASTPRAGDTVVAAKRFDQARALFEDAEGRLDSWWARPIAALPVAAQNARALRVMTRGGRELSATGADTARRANPDDIKPANGVVPLDEVRALDAPLTRASAALVSARADLASIDSPWLVSPLAEKLHTLDAKMTRGVRTAETARLAVATVPLSARRRR